MFNNKRNALLTLGVSAGLLFSAAAANAQGRHGPPPPGPPPLQSPASVATAQQQAADAVQRAYDALGRSAALSQTASQDTANILTQGKDAYEKALTQYQASDFVGANETAMAAADMAHAAEQIANANLMEAASRQSQIPAPPTAAANGSFQTARAYQDLSRVSDHRARIISQLSAGAAPSARSQVNSLMEESNRLQQRAQTLLKDQKPQQASAIAGAADAMLAAADHMEQCALIASGMVPAQAGPPPPPGGFGPPPPPPQL